MKLSCLFIIVIMPLISFCQSATQIETIARSQAHRFKANFVVNGVNKQSIGMGFILKGEYFATCYHLISSPEDGSKAISAYMTYNERFVKGIYKYDSV